MKTAALLASIVVFLTSCNTDNKWVKVRQASPDIDWKFRRTAVIEVHKAMDINDTLTYKFPGNYIKDMVVIIKDIN